MSKNYSRFSVQPMDDDWKEEFAFQIDPNASPAMNTFSGQEAKSMTDRLRSTTGRKPLRSSRLQSVVQANNPNTNPLRVTASRQLTSAPMPAVAKTKQLSTLSTRSANAVSSDVVPIQSLVGALQSTINAQLPRREVVVIPGNGRRRRQASAEEAESQVRLRRRVRHGAVILAILAIMMITFISLAPLANGEASNPMVNQVMNWVKTQQQEWQIMARSTEQDGQANNPADPANPAAPPPAALPKSQYVAIAQQAAIANGIPPGYFVQQINAESGFNPGAVSPSGAVGIAQMIPSTAAGIGANPYDPISALNGAARLMAGYYKQYGDYAKALAAYNAGSGTLDYAIKAGGANWMSFLPAETRNYIFKIMGI